MAKIKIRRDVTSNWVSANPILASGEMGLDTEMKMIKIGDGVTPWNSLNFYSGLKPMVLDMGEVSGNVEVDLSYSAVKMHLTGNANITFTNPPALGVSHSTTFYITRNIGSNAVIELPPVSWSSQVEPRVIDILTTIFTVSTINAGASYYGFTNAISYEVAAVDESTIWNSNDKWASILIENDGTKITDSVVAYNRYHSVRALGGKVTGRHRLSIAFNDLPSSNSNNAWALMFGIATAAASLDALGGGVGYQVPSMAISVVATSTKTLNKVKNGVATSFGALTLAANGILSFVVDFNEGKIWFQQNGAYLTAGANPETGENPDYVFEAGSVYFPMLSLARLNANGGTPATTTLLSKVQDPWGFTTPSYENWTR